MKTLFKQIGSLLLVSGLLAFAGNHFNPRGIPWEGNWSNPVEAQAAKRGVPVISLHTARERLAAGDTVFLDARPEAVFAAGHIPGALNMPLQAIEARFGQLAEWVAADRSLVVYCTDRHCDAALLLALELQAMGAEKVELFVDGFAAWKRHGGRVEEGP